MRARAAVEGNEVTVCAERGGALFVSGAVKVSYDPFLVDVGVGFYVVHDANAEGGVCCVVGGKGTTPAACPCQGANEAVTIARDREGASVGISNVEVAGSVSGVHGGAMKVGNCRRGETGRI